MSIGTGTLSFSQESERSLTKIATATTRPMPWNEGADADSRAKSK